MYFNKKTVGKFIFHIEILKACDDTEKVVSLNLNKLKWAAKRVPKMTTLKNPEIKEELPGLNSICNTNRTESSLLV